MFELTESKVHLNEHISALAAGISIFLCLTVLLTSLWIWSERSARHILDRVSFRILLWTMGFEIVYDINYICVVLASKPNAGCSVGIYFMMATLGIVNYLCTCIAVNLALAVVFGLNPLRLRLEWWYLGVSLFIGFFVPIVPAALGHFGWDPILNVCWIRADNDKTRLRNFVLDLYMWQALSCVIASVAVIATLITLFRQGRATSRALFEGNSLNMEVGSQTFQSEQQQQTKPSGMFSRAFGSRRRSIASEREQRFGHLEDRFISIALRISMYPIALIIVNGIIIVGDLYISKAGGVHSTAVYGLYCVYYFLYGGRGIIFALLAIFIDPCLSKGVRATWRAKYPPKRASTSTKLCEKSPASSSNTPGLPYVAPDSTALPNATFPATATAASSTFVPPAPTSSKVGGEGSVESLDFFSALCMPEDAEERIREREREEDRQRDRALRDARAKSRALSAPLPFRFLLRSRRRSGDVEASASVGAAGLRVAARVGEEEDGIDESDDGFTQTFAGVPAGGLPEGMHDTLDVIDEVSLAALTPLGTSSPITSRRASRSESQRPSECIRQSDDDRGRGGRGLNDTAAARYSESVRRSESRQTSSRRPSGVTGTNTTMEAEERRKLRRQKALEMAERLYEEKQAHL